MLYVIYLYKIIYDSNSWYDTKGHIWDIAGVVQHVLNPACSTLPFSYPLPK